MPNNSSQTGPIYDWESRDSVATPPPPQVIIKRPLIMVRFDGIDGKAVICGLFVVVMALLTILFGVLTALAWWDLDTSTTYSSTVGRAWAYTILDICAACGLGIAVATYNYVL